MGHPVALHALDELAGCVGDLAGFVGEVKHTAVTGDEEGGLDQRQLHLEFYLLDQPQEASCEFVEWHVQLVTEVVQQIWRLSEPESNVIGCSRIIVHVLTLAKEVMLIGQFDDPNSLVDAALQNSFTHYRTPPRHSSASSTPQSSSWRYRTSSGLYRVRCYSRISYRPVLQSQLILRLMFTNSPTSYWLGPKLSSSASFVPTMVFPQFWQTMSPSLLGYNGPF